MNGSTDPVGRFEVLVAALAAERIYSTVVGAAPGAAVGHLDTRRQVRYLYGLTAGRLQEAGDALRPARPGYAETMDRKGAQRSRWLWQLAARMIRHRILGDAERMEAARMRDLEALLLRELADFFGDDRSRYRRIEP